MTAGQLVDYLIKHIRLSYAGKAMRKAIEMLVCIQPIANQKIMGHCWLDGANQSLHISEVDGGHHFRYELASCFGATT